jgi:hypothetical protein
MARGFFYSTPTLSIGHLCTSIGLAYLWHQSKQLSIKYPQSRMVEHTFKVEI